MNIKKIGNYKHFGIRKEWLEEFFEDPDRWWTENSLGPVQFEAMRRWLVDAEIITDRSKGFTLTDIGKLLREIGADDTFTWAVIWTNLARNSSLISWYVSELEWGKTYSRDELLELMGDKLSIATRKNGLQSLIELFKYSPIGYELEIGIPIIKRGRCVAILKKGVSLQPKLKIPPLSLLYALYRYAESKNCFEFQISELYDEKDPENPHYLFGIPQYALECIIAELTELYHKIVSLEDNRIIIQPKSSFIIFLHLTNEV
jgi:phosphoadenosine phosphosulfate reductase